MPWLWSYSKPHVRLIDRSGYVVRFFIDTDTSRFIAAVDNNASPAKLELKRGDLLDISVFFVSGSAPELLTGTVIVRAGLRAVGSYDGEPLALLPSLAIPTVADDPYSGNLDLNTNELLSELANAAHIDANFEVTYSLDGGSSWTSSVNLPTRVHNDIVRGDEGVPQAATPPYPAPSELARLNASNVFTGSNEFQGGTSLSGNTECGAIQVSNSATFSGPATFNSYSVFTANVDIAGSVGFYSNNVYFYSSSVDFNGSDVLVNAADTPQQAVSLGQARLPSLPVGSYLHSVDWDFIRHTNFVGATKTTGYFNRADFGVADYEVIGLVKQDAANISTYYYSRGVDLNENSLDTVGKAAAIYSAPNSGSSMPTSAYNQDWCYSITFSINSVAADFDTIVGLSKITRTGTGQASYSSGDGALYLVSSGGSISLYFDGTVQISNAASLNQLYTMEIRRDTSSHLARWRLYNHTTKSWDSGYVGIALGPSGTKPAHLCAGIFKTATGSGTSSMTVREATIAYGVK